MAACLLAVSVGPASAQGTQGTIAEVTAWKPKPGMTQQFQQGRKKHMEFHRAQNDAWAWLTWEIVNGERNGQLVTGTFNHHWKDFDGRASFDEKDSADAAVNLMPFTESSTSGHYALMEDASRPPAATKPVAMAQVTHYFVKLEGVTAFTDALKELKTALDTINWPIHSRWYRLVSGGEGPQYVLSVDRNSWAEMEPPATSMEKALSEVLGPRKTTELFDAIRKNTRYVTSEMFVFRPELSYFPAK
jgi:hypothetical protein